jgi:serine/threonine protein kinase
MEEATVEYSNGMAVYSGHVNGDGKPQGQGCVKYSNNKTLLLEGDFLPATMNGQTGKEEIPPMVPGGTLVIFENGEVYEGKFTDGKPEGEVKITSIDGLIYEGKLVDGVLVGPGKVTLSNGIVHEGVFVDKTMKMGGKGKITFLSGETYEVEREANNNTFWCVGDDPISIDKSLEMKRLRDIALNNEPDLFEGLVIDPIIAQAEGHEITKLGEGANGVVYKVYNGKLGKYVALKITKKYFRGTGNNTLIGGDKLIFRLLERDRGESSFRHGYSLSATVNIYGVSENGHVVVLELCERGGFEHNGPDDIALLENNLKPIVNSIDYLHFSSLVHGDIKPANFMVTEDGRLLLGDYGNVQDPFYDYYHYSGRIGPCFTGNYRAPECFNGYDIASRNIQYGEYNEFKGRNYKIWDYWALGVTFCEKILGCDESKRGDHLYDRFIDSIPELRGNNLKDEHDRYLSMSRFIIDYPEAWRTFIKTELGKVKVPISPLLGKTVKSLLEPDAKMAERMIGSIVSEIRLEKSEEEQKRRKASEMMDMEKKNLEKISQEELKPAGESGAPKVPDTEKKTLEKEPDAPVASSIGMAIGELGQELDKQADEKIKGKNTANGTGGGNFFG